MLDLTAQFILLPDVIPQQIRNYSIDFSRHNLTAASQLYNGEIEANEGRYHIIVV